VQIVGRRHHTDRLLAIAGAVEQCLQATGRQPSGKDRQ
jgi:Asp-tRNA(Asn)/Glu-tRNA(Gln) amidotransferase A subunit family amidase